MLASRNAEIVSVGGAYDDDGAPAAASSSAAQSAADTNPLASVEAMVAVRASFGLVGALSLETNGRAVASLAYGSWHAVGEPLGDASVSANKAAVDLVLQQRAAAGLKAEIPAVKDFADRL